MTNKRTYEETHPWISFKLDMRRAPYDLWMLLGKAQGLCNQLCHVPMTPLVAQELHRLYLAKGALATTAIEGNTLSEDEVKRILEKKLILPPSKHYLQQEVENIFAACNRIATQVINGNLPPLSRDLVEEYNGIVLDALKLEEGVVAGELRSHSVTVSRYRGAPAEDCRFLLDRMCEWISGDAFHPPSGFHTAFAILRAMIAHLYIAWIHPFGDGNGRTARLVELHILMASGLPAPAAHLLSNHYNQTRTEYYRQLDAASRTGGDVMPFLKYAVQGMVDGLKEQWAIVNEQQVAITWEHFVYSRFRNKASKVDVRRRKLVIELGRQTSEGGVPFEDITTLNRVLAEEYLRVGQRTLQRDLAEMIRENLISKVPGTNRYRANIETVMNMLPVRATNISL